MVIFSTYMAGSWGHFPKIKINVNKVQSFLLLLWLDCLVSGVLKCSVGKKKVSKYLECRKPRNCVQFWKTLTAAHTPLSLCHAAARFQPSSALHCQRPIFGRVLSTWWSNCSSEKCACVTCPLLRSPEASFWKRWNELWRALCLGSFGTSLCCEWGMIPPPCGCHLGLLSSCSSLGAAEGACWGQGQWQWNTDHREIRILVKNRRNWDWDHYLKLK